MTDAYSNLTPPVVFPPFIKKRSAQEMRSAPQRKPSVTEKAGDKRVSTSRAGKRREKNAAESITPEEKPPNALFAFPLSPFRKNTSTAPHTVNKNAPEAPKKACIQTGKSENFVIGIILAKQRRSLYVSARFFIRSARTASFRRLLYYTHKKRSSVRFSDCFLRFSPQIFNLF